MTKKDYNENKLIKDIQKFCEENPVVIGWDMTDELNNDDIAKIVYDRDDWEMQMDELNFEYTSQCIDDFVKNELVPEFGERIKAIGQDYDLESYLYEFAIVDLNFQSLYKSTDVICTITMYSNYDCCNSFDTMETSDYMAQVYKRVRKGVSKNDFIHAHREGAFGGSVFVFVFKTTLYDYLELKEKSKTKKYFLIPKGTQFGFYSSGQGSSSFFSTLTFQDCKIKLQETGKHDTKHDIAKLECNNTISYSIKEIFGETDFIDKQEIKII